MSLIDRGFFVHSLHNDDLFETWMQLLVTTERSRHQLVEHLVKCRQLFLTDERSNNKMEAAITLLNHFTGAIRHGHYKAEGGLVFKYDKITLSILYSAYLQQTQQKKKIIASKVALLQDTYDDEIHKEIQSAISEVRTYCMQGGAAASAVYETPVHAKTSLRSSFVSFFVKKDDKKKLTMQRSSRELNENNEEEKENLPQSISVGGCC